MKPPCPACGYVHSAADVIAVARFQRVPQGGYRVRFDTTNRLYPTREAAEAALCAERTERRQSRPTASATHPAPRSATSSGRSATRPRHPPASPTRERAEQALAAMPNADSMQIEETT